VENPVLQGVQVSLVNEKKKKSIRPLSFEITFSFSSLTSPTYNKVEIWWVDFPFIPSCLRHPFCIWLLIPFSQSLGRSLWVDKPFHGSPLSPEPEQVHYSTSPRWRISDVRRDRVKSEKSG
jgi:hypothetical protein